MTKRRRFAIGVTFAIALLFEVALYHHWGFVRGNLIVLLDLPYSRQAAPFPSSPVQAKLVAHAGGAFRDLAYTNSREAMDEHYAEGYRVFELDFHWTSLGDQVKSGHT